MADKPFIYMDHAATTSVRPEVVEAMLPYFTQSYGNPSSIYSISQKNRSVVNRCRDVIADSLNAGANEIFFTAGGSEADNWAIKGVAEAYAGDGIMCSNGVISGNSPDLTASKYNTGRHIITTKIEHHAVLHTCQYLEKKGYEVTYLDVDEAGIVKLDQLKRAIRPDTMLISIMFANNEIGVIEPIKEIGEIAREHGIIFHTDAVQAYGQVPIDVDEYNIDLLSASGHKLNGPKGVGFLYIRNGIKIGSFIHGGAQERGRRAGTENVPGIVGLSKAVEMAFDTMDTRNEREIMLRDHMIDRITSEIPYTRLNGHRTKRLPNNVNISFQFIEGESMLIMLDMAGICASAGSACTSGSIDPSHVLTAIGLPEDIARGSLRMTLGEENTMEEVDYVVEQLKKNAEKLRAMSPQYEDYMKS